ETSEHPPASTDAPFPFNSPSADVILQSSDNVRFRVRKAILSEASPVFDNMFSLPPEQANLGSSAFPNLPIVPMSEDSATLEGILRLCYPPDGSLRKISLDTISRLFPVLRKYALDRAEAYVVETLRSMAETAPLRVYCLSIQYELDEDLTRAAARAFLGESVHSVHTYSAAELDCVSASAYIRLLDYHRRCVTAARDAVAGFLAADTKLTERCWATCNPGKQGYCNTFQTLQVNGFERSIMSWFINLVSYCIRLVEDRPSGRVIRSPATVKTSLTEALRCASCKRRAWDDVQEFSFLVQAAIDQATAQVAIEAVVSLGNRNSLGFSAGFDQHCAA
ncbi:hypothetical protein FOMPIDRAFT_1116450, partial [Fomitopsis schrenkii]